jgi:large subunit ribosomal protein L30
MASRSEPPATKTVTSKPRRRKGERAKVTGLRIELVRSPIGYSSRQRAILTGLGLRRMRQVVERPDTVEIRGMIAKVSHLVALR